MSVFKVIHKKKEKDRKKNDYFFLFTAHDKVGSEGNCPLQELKILPVIVHALSNLFFFHICLIRNEPYIGKDDTRYISQFGCCG